MKKNEIVELNGVEYTLELNRDSFLQIDKICNVQKSMDIIQRGLYDYIEDIDDNYVPTVDELDDAVIEEKIKETESTLRKIVERSFFIWMYPNHKFTISQVREIVNPYLQDEVKARFIGEKLATYLNACIEIRQDYNNQVKNLRAQANK